MLPLPRVTYLAPTSSTWQLMNLAMLWDCLIYRGWCLYCVCFIYYPCCANVNYITLHQIALIIQMEIYYRKYFALTVAYIISLSAYTNTAANFSITFTTICLLALIFFTVI